MSPLELLDKVQELEDHGYMIFLKWDGERAGGKKTLMITLPGTDLSIRKDSDDMWGSLESAIEEIQGRANKTQHHKSDRAGGSEA